MSLRSFGGGAVLALVAATAASADPLTYAIQAANPVVQVAIDGDVSVTYSPLLGPPTTISLLNGTTNTFGRPRGSAVADVGLPNAFLGGAHGIVVSSFQANTEFGDSTFLFTDLFGQLPPIPSPVPLVGAGLLIHIADLELVQGTPVTSQLHPNGAPNGFTWSGETSPLTVNGSIDVSVLIPGQEPIGLPATSTFSVAMSPAPFFGGFTGDATTTTLDVGVDALEVDPDTSQYLAPIELNLGVLGGISVNVTRLRFRIDGAYTGINKKFGLPPPSGMPGCGIGPELALLVPALGFLHGRRRRASA